MHFWAKLLPMITLVVAIALLVGSSQAKRGCASFGHSCFGGHGKRSDQMQSNDETQAAAAPAVPVLSPIDYRTLDLFRQICSLQPEHYQRLAPVFQNMVDSIIAEEEPLPRK